MDKIHKYAKKYCDGKVIVSTLGDSYYYHFNDGKFILRISNHIGRNSDGKMSIIIDENGYMLHNHVTGNVYIETYEKIKEIIKSLSVMSKMNMKFDMANRVEYGELKQKANILNQQVDSLKNKNQKLADTNTKLNNENTKFKSQINSQKKSFDDLQEEMRCKPLRTWLKLLLNKK